MIDTSDSPLVDELHPSPNIEPRCNGATPTLLILHYTGLPTVEKSIEVLADPICKVSCHYVIGLDGTVTQMVAESMRAWHAGLSSWRGETDINSQSIGIEIQNVGHNHGYPEFPKGQMERVRDLAQDIVKRNAIQSEHVLAHSDIAPSRKTDPGEKFDWAWLYRAGIGHWVPPVPIDEDERGVSMTETDALVRDVQGMLRAYGYGIDVTGRHDETSQTVVAAFQRHFRPARVDGKIDRSTVATLRNLLDALKTNAKIA